jgi:hypothetical protein
MQSLKTGRVKNKHQEDQQLNNKQDKIYKKKKKGENTARTSKGSCLPNLPLIEGHQDASLAV